MYARSALAMALVVVGIGAGASSTWAMSVKQIAAFQQAKITLQDAVGIAQREVPGGWIVDADIAVVKGQGTYTVEVVKERVYAVRVDLQNGRVLETVRRRIPPKDWKPMAVVEGAPVGLLDAVTIAEKTFPGAKIVSADVKIRRGSVRWGVTIDDNGLYTVDVDPEKGGVLRVSRIPTRDRVLVEIGALP